MDDEGLQMLAGSYMRRKRWEYRMQALGFGEVFFAKGKSPMSERNNISIDDFNKAVSSRFLT